MRREIYDDLLKWKKSNDRKPLLLQGVRQCGKTYILKEFGKENYEDVAYFTFEKNPSLHVIFQKDLDPKRLLNELSVMRDKKIEPGKTLLILDEIQLCGRALTSLKFFCEEAQEYHVATAGSLLGVLLAKKFSFPVGKVKRLKMYPMTFREFLLANSADLLVEHVDGADPTEPLSEPIADKLKAHLNNYFLVGGMPAAVSSWTANGDHKNVEEVLDDIIDDYVGDFAKHAPEHITKLTLIWNSIPAQLARDNRKFVFGHVKTGMRAKDLEDALEWLVNAGLVHKVKKVNEARFPLSAYSDNTNFKVYMADIGILRRMAKVPSDFIFSEHKEHKDLRGAITENYVLNEIIPRIRDDLYYWRSGNAAEVDLVAQIEGVVVPIEAKAGNSKSKSLTEFITRYDPKIAVTTTARRNVSGVVKHIPLYLQWRVADHVRSRKLF